MPASLFVIRTNFTALCQDSRVLFSGIFLSFVKFNFSGLLLVCCNFAQKHHACLYIYSLRVSVCDNRQLYGNFFRLKFGWGGIGGLERVCVQFDGLVWAFLFEEFRVLDHFLQNPGVRVFWSMLCGIFFLTLCHLFAFYNIFSHIGAWRCLFTDRRTHSAERNVFHFSFSFFLFFLFFIEIWPPTYITSLIPWTMYGTPIKNNNLYFS